MPEIQDACNSSRRSRFTQAPSRFLSLGTAVLAACVLAFPAIAEAKTYHVNRSISSAGDGKSWKSAFKYLRDALDESTEGDVIYVAKGTYYPDEGSSGIFGDREETFELNGQKIYGGFIGNETSASQRDPQANPTILSGAIWNFEGDDVYWSLHVMVLNKSSSLDGFTVEDGHASGSDSWSYPSILNYDEGGGCYVKSGQTLTISRCVFRNNRALTYGGAIMVQDDTGKVVATDCVFEGNEIPLIYNFASGFPAGGAIKGNVEATRCKFISNSVSAINPIEGDVSTAAGGAIAGNATLVDCEFIGNTVAAHRSIASEKEVKPVGSGGAVSGDVKATRCTFSGNEAYATEVFGHSMGGATADGSVMATNCVFTGNKSATGRYEPTDEKYLGGGGAVFALSGDSSLANCIFIGNSSLFRGGAVHGGTTDYKDSLLIGNCTFLDNEVLESAYGAAAVSCDGIVRILNNIFWIDAPATEGFDQQEMIRVFKGGVLRNSLANYPTPSTVAPNIVRSGASGLANGPGGDMFLGSLDSVILTGDPLFSNISDPDGADNIWGTSDDGLQVRSGGSAVITTSDPRIKKPENHLPEDVLDIDSDTDSEEDLPVDMKGVVRVQNNYLDLGAYEFGNLPNIPEIVVVEDSEKLEVGDSVNFGKTAKKKKSKKTFTIRNTGNTGLRISSVKITGSERFSIKGNLPDAIKPGESASFTVIFKPKGKGKEKASLRISNSDGDEAQFDINLKGKGILKKKGKAGSKKDTIKKKSGKSTKKKASSISRIIVGGGTETEFFSAGPRSSATVTKTIEADGRTYLLITVRKSGSADAGTVQVSPDLVDWYSGPKHTTVVEDSASILSVRDNTPLIKGVKRHIRVK